MGGARRHPLPVSVYRLIWTRTRLLQIVILAFGLGLPALAVVPIEVQRRIVDDGLMQADARLVFVLFACGLLAYLAAGGLKFAVFYFRGLVAAKITRTLRVRAISVQSSRSATRGRRAVGPITAIVSEECETMGSFCAEAVNTPLIEGGALLSVAGFLFVHEPSLAAIGVGSLVLQAVLTPMAQRRINLLSALRVRTMRRTARDIMDATDGGCDIRFGRALRDVRRAFQIRLRMNVLKALLKSVLKLIDNFALLGVFAFGAAMVISGQTTLGVVTAFAAALKQVRDPWRTLLNFYRSLSDAKVKYRMILAALEEEPNDVSAAEVAASLQAFEADAAADAVCAQRTSQRQMAEPSRA